MQKIKLFLSNLSLDKYIILAFLIRAMFSDFGFAQAFALLVLLSYVAYTSWLEKQKANLAETELRQEMQNIRDIVSGIGIRLNAKPDQTTNSPKRFF